MWLWQHVMDKQADSCTSHQRKQGRPGLKIDSFVFSVSSFRCSSHLLARNKIRKRRSSNTDNIPHSRLEQKTSRMRKWPFPWGSEFGRILKRFLVGSVFFLPRMLFRLHAARKQSDTYASKKRSFLKRRFIPSVIVICHFKIVLLLLYIFTMTTP